VAQNAPILVPSHPSGILQCPSLIFFPLVDAIRINPLFALFSLQGHKQKFKVTHQIAREPRICHFPQFPEWPYKWLIDVSH